jgi:hypothetical protein
MEEQPLGKADRPELERAIFSEETLEEVRQELLGEGFDEESVDRWLSRHRAPTFELPEADEQDSHLH